MKKYISLTQPIGEANEMEISVGYEKGGINYFSGKMNKRGIYVYITPIRRKDGSISKVLLGDTHSTGFKVLIKEIGRKSDKAIDEISSKFTDEMLSKIVSAYENFDYGKVRDLVISL